MGSDRRIRPYGSRLLALGVLFALGFMAPMAGADDPAGAGAAAEPVYETSIVFSSSFEWRVRPWRPRGARVRVASGGLVGTHAARVSRRMHARRTMLARRILGRTVAGDAYELDAAVRSARRIRNVCLRIREWKAGIRLGGKTRCMASVRHWRAFPTVTYVARGGGRLVVSVTRRNASATSLKVDRVTLKRKRRVTAPSATTTTETTTATVTETGSTSTETAPTTTETTSTTTTGGDPSTTTGTTTSPASDGIPADAYYLAPNGSDANPGTAAAPWRTFAASLERLRPGDTLVAHGGLYTERATGMALRPGTASALITVRNYPGERPVLKGLLWLTSPSYWVFDGITVTWDPATGAPNEHMVKIHDGVGWRVTRSEFFGAHSYAAVLIASTSAGEPADWRFDHNVVHDTYASNNTNQDHLLYVNSGLTGGPGLIDHNLFFNATNGNGVKLGYTEVGGASNVDVRYNTVVNVAQAFLVAGQSSGNRFDHNICFTAVYTCFRAYKLTGSNNAFSDNVGGDAPLWVYADSGFGSFSGGAGNRFPVDPRFDSSYVPRDATFAAYGYAAG